MGLTVNLSYRQYDIAEANTIDIVNEFTVCQALTSVVLQILYGLFVSWCRNDYTLALNLNAEF